jgi:sugar lactone lactonase YvrE
MKLHSSLRLLASCAVLAALAASVAVAQDAQPKDGRYYFAQATKAYQAKDYPSFLENMKMAVSLRPGHPAYVYNTAGAYALAGKPEEALAWLEKFAAMGMIGDVEKDTDFESIKSLPRFRDVLGKLAANKAPSGGSEAAFTVPVKGLVPEGVAYDPETKTFFLSSVHEHKIFAVGQDGKVRDFSSEKDGLLGVLGIRVDAKRRRLWAASAVFPEIPGFDKASGRRSAVFEYDLKTGKLLTRHTPPEGSGEHIFGDLVVASNGDVYVSDSASPVVFVIKAGRGAVEEFVRDGLFLNLQGIALSPDEKTLFLADYSRGVVAVDMATKRATALPIPDAATVLGIDGLYFHSGSLIGIQNGVAPHRIIRLALSKDFSRVERVSVVAANDPAWDEPTLGVLVGDMLYYNAVSQWGNVGEGGKFAKPEALRDAVVMKVKLQ